MLNTESLIHYQHRLKHVDSALSTDTSDSNALSVTTTKVVSSGSSNALTGGSGLGQKVNAVQDEASLVMSKRQKRQHEVSSFACTSPHRL